MSTKSGFFIFSSLYYYTVYTADGWKEETLSVIVLEPRLDQHPSFDFVVCIHDSVWRCYRSLSLFLCYNYLTRSSEHRISIRSFLSLLALSLLGVFLLIPSISFLPSPSFFFLFSSSGFPCNQARKKRERDREREGILSRQQHQLMLVAQSRSVGPVGTGRPI